MAKTPIHSLPFLFAFICVTSAQNPSAPIPGANPTLNQFGTTPTRDNDTTLRPLSPEEVPPNLNFYAVNPLYRALRLLPDSNALPPITPENFADYAPHLKTVAPQLFEITTGGKPLKLTSSEVKISGDADITFHLVYTRPPAGTLRFVAHYLFHLVDGHVGTLVVNDADGKDLGWSPVSVEQPAFEVPVPAPATAARKP